MAGCCLQLCLMEQRSLLTGWNICSLMHAPGCSGTRLPVALPRLPAFGFLRELPARIFRFKASGVQSPARCIHCKAFGAQLPARCFRCKVSRERLPAHGFLFKAFRVLLPEHGFRRETASHLDVIDLIRGEKILKAAVAQCLKERKKLAASRKYETLKHCMQVEARTSPDYS